MSAPLAHQTYGDGGPTIVLVAGLGDPKEAWGRVAPDLAEWARVTTIDNPGVGGSAEIPAPDRIAPTAASVIETIDALGLERVHLVGHSMGGMIVQEVALARPERLASLVLCCTYANAGAYCSRLLASLRAVAGAIGAREARRQLLPWAFTPTFFLEHPDEVAAVEDILAGMPQEDPTFVAQLDALEAHDARGRLGAIELPTAVVAAEHDILIPADRTQALLAELPEGRGVQVPGGHACHWEEPRGVADAIAEHVEDVGSA